jgi:hypothetical protein
MVHWNRAEGLARLLRGVRNNRPLLIPQVAGQRESLHSAWVMHAPSLQVWWRSSYREHAGARKAVGGMIPCPQCGHMNEATASFCRSCGNRLPQATPAGGPVWPNNGPVTMDDDNGPAWLRALREQQQADGYPPPMPDPMGPPPGAWPTPDAPAVGYNGSPQPAPWGSPPAQPAAWNMPQPQQPGAWSSPQVDPWAMPAQPSQPPPWGPPQTPQNPWGQPPAQPMRETVFSDAGLPEWLQQGQAQMAAGQPPPLNFGPPSTPPAWNAPPASPADPPWMQQPSAGAQPFGAPPAGQSEYAARQLVEDGSLPAWLRAYPEGSAPAPSAGPAWTPPAQPAPDPTSWGAPPAQPDPFRSNASGGSMLSASDLVDESALPAWLRSTPEPAVPPAASAWGMPMGPGDVSQVETGRWPANGQLPPDPSLGQRYDASDLIDPSLRGGTPPLPSQPPSAWGAPPAPGWGAPPQPQQPYSGADPYGGVPPPTNLPDFFPRDEAAGYTPGSPGYSPNAPPQGYGPPPGYYPPQGGYDPTWGQAPGYPPQQGGYDQGWGQQGGYPPQGGFDPGWGPAPGYPPQGGYDPGWGQAPAYPPQSGYGPPQGYPPQGGYGQGYGQQGYDPSYGQPPGPNGSEFDPLPPGDPRQQPPQDGRARRWYGRNRAP